MRPSEAGHYRLGRELPHPPCYACGFAAMCRDRRLACAPFVSFVETGTFNRDANRRPTPALFRTLFPQLQGDHRADDDTADCHADR